MSQNISLASSHMPTTTRRRGEGLKRDGMRRSPSQMTVIILSFAAVIFLLDLVTPLGIPYWLLYGAPFFFIRYKTPRQFAYVLAALCTILLLVGYVLSPGGRTESLTHRASAVIIL